jgi:hypothetical protein
MSQGYLEPTTGVPHLAGPALRAGGRRTLLGPLLFWAFAAVLIVYAAGFSVNAQLWLACALTLPLTVWVVGGDRAYPVLLWVVGMYWTQIAGDLLGADINRVALDDGPMGPYQAQAILYSLAALFMIGLGMRVGAKFITPRRRTIARQWDLTAQSISLRRAMLWYAGAALLAAVLIQAANLVSALRQPVLGFVLLKFVFFYILVAKVFELRRGYKWLALALCYETAIGITGFIASYHAAFIVLLIAAAAHTPRRFSLPQILAGVGTLALLFFVSVVWTAIKPEYRAWANGGSGEQIVVQPIGQRVEWIVDRLLSGNIDYAEGTTKLVARIGYTDFYAKTLVRLDQGVVPADLDLWWAGVMHVVRPRILFPDKAELDDTAITSLLTGETFGDDTSVSIGYVAEANVDFGFPGMLLPIFAIGLMLGATARYFMTRPVPPVVCEAFATASIFLSFQYAHNIDKELGGFVTGFLALFVSMKYGYPYASRWLFDAKPKMTTALPR